MMGKVDLIIIGTVLLRDDKNTRVDCPYPFGGGARPGAWGGVLFCGCF
jgi:hypothetical protein